MGGQRLVVAGTVLTTDCRPVKAALLDFWQADDAGQYDNQGYRLRGHQFTDAGGGWRLGDGGARPLHRPHPPHPRQGPGPRRTRPHHPALLPGRAGQRPRRHLLPRAAAGDVRDTGGVRQGSFTFVLEA